MRRGCRWLLLALVALSAGAAEPGTVRVEVEAEGATIGDQLPARIVVELPSTTHFEPPPVGPNLGDFSVIDGAWDARVEEESDRRRWVWRGHIAAYSTGRLEVPPFRLEVDSPNGRLALESEPVPVELGSVLTEADEGPEAEIADLKPPASIAADLGPLIKALWILGGLLLLALVAWWLQRRYASRLAAAEVPRDPFHRTPPHVWVYAELKQLLERRLPEQGQVDRFYEELSWILKKYLGGRFRVELLERTSAEVPQELSQAGCPADAVQAVAELLSDADTVKFARRRPAPQACRDAVEQVYRIVDRTKPLEAPGAVAGAA